MNYIVEYLYTLTIQTIVIFERKINKNSIKTCHNFTLDYIICYKKQKIYFSKEEIEEQRIKFGSNEAIKPQAFRIHK